MDNWFFCNSVTQSFNLELMKAGQFISKASACLPVAVVTSNDAVTCYAKYSVRPGESLNFTWMEQTTSSTLTDNMGTLSMEWFGEIEAPVPNQLRCMRCPAGALLSADRCGTPLSCARSHRNQQAGWG
jgi:hypothetical protein